MREITTNYWQKSRIIGKTKMPCPRKRVILLTPMAGKAEESPPKGGNYYVHLRKDPLNGYH
jgi:hypothetical protein